MPGSEPGAVAAGPHPYGSSVSTVCWSGDPMLRPMPLGLRVFGGARSSDVLPVEERLTRPRSDSFDRVVDSF